MKALNQVINNLSVVENQLKGNSANCKFTIAKNKSNETFFIKVQVNPYKDDLNIDNVVGKILQEIYKSLEPKPSEWLIPNYVGCCRVNCKITQNDIYNLSLDPQIKPPYISSVANVQEAIEDPVALYDVFAKINADVIPYAYNYICKLFQFITKMGRTYSFVHNDAHLGNIQLSKKTGQLYLIDMGRVGIRIPQGLNSPIDLNRLIEDVITDTTTFINPKLDEDEVLKYRIEIENDITYRLDCFVCPSQYSYVFDISTIVMNILRIFYHRGYLQTFIGDVKQHISIFEFSFIDIVENGKKIEYIEVNHPDILTKISEYLSPGTPGTPQVPVFINYLVTGLLVLSSIAIEHYMYSTLPDNENVFWINFTELLEQKVMFRGYQYVLPVNESLAKEVYTNSYRSIADRRRPSRQQNPSPKTKTSTSGTTPLDQKSKPWRGGTTTITTTQNPSSTKEEENSKHVKGSTSSSTKSSTMQSQSQCEIDFMQHKAYTYAWDKALADPNSVRCSPPKPPTGYSWNIERKEIEEIKKGKKPISFPNRNVDKDIVSNIDIPIPGNLVEALDKIRT